MSEDTPQPSTNEQDLEPEDFEFARSLILHVGQSMRAQIVGDEYETTWKPDNTPVTVVDLSASRQINEAIHETFPLDRIFNEEESLEGSSGLTWVIDPTDGTQSLGILNTATCCIGRTDAEGKPIFGLVYNPMTDELFSARRGEPATLNNLPIEVSAKTQLQSSYIFLGSRMPETVATNGTVYDRLEGQGAKVLNARSLAFGCAMVAAGKAEGAYIGVKTPFEAAAVKLIVEGAGGKVTDLLGNDAESFRYDGEIQGLVVSNGHLHDALLTALQKRRTEGIEHGDY